MTIIPRTLIKNLPRDPPVRPLKGPGDRGAEIINEEHYRWTGVRRRALFQVWRGVCVCGGGPFFRSGASASPSPSPSNY